MTSPYLSRPLRTEAQARAYMARTDLSDWTQAIDPALISDAAETTELLSEDELEQFAMTYHKPNLRR